MSSSAKARRKKQRIAARDGGWRCHYCERALDPIMNPKAKHPVKVVETTPTLDHVVPQSLGGTSDLSNLVLSCFPCNTSKGSGASPSTQKLNRTASPLGDLRHGTVFDLWIEMYGEKKAKRLTSVYPSSASKPV